MAVRAIKWIGGIDGYLELIDQRKLCADFVMLNCESIEEVYYAIKTLAVRGAPAIGVSAGYGVLLGMREIQAGESLAARLKECCEYLSTSRPTAVNLFWALERIERVGREYIEANGDGDIDGLMERLLAEAEAIRIEDEQMCHKMGEHGQSLIKEGSRVLTHCNAGALATAGDGTALSVLYSAAQRGKSFKVYADETRPLLQGARLTAWELQEGGIDVTVICDNMAGWLMKQGEVDLVITGADRIAANGDAANKIGTYSLSVLARENNVPFYIAAPSSTFDLELASGADIPIEQRNGDEVCCFAGVRTAPKGVGVYNPALDVTEAADIAAIITEKGIIKRPDRESILKMLG